MAKQILDEETKQMATKGGLLALSTTLVSAGVGLLTTGMKIEGAIALAAGVALVFIREYCKK